MKFLLIISRTFSSGFNTTGNVLHTDVPHACDIEARLDSVKNAMMILSRLEISEHCLDHETLKTYRQIWKISHCAFDGYDC